MRKSFLAATLVGGFLMVAGIGTPASAAPLGAGALAAATESSTGVVEKVHLRPYRHCHWSRGVRWCHGPHWRHRHWRHRHWRHRHWRHRHGRHRHWRRF